MRPVFIFFLFSILIFCGTACKEVEKKSSLSGVNVMIQDIRCEEVINKIMEECKNQGFPFEWTDQNRGLLSIGPLTTAPLPEDPFSKMDENVRLEINCPEPLSTRLSLQIQLRGLTADNRWLEVKDTDKLNAYGKRFLDRIGIK